MARSVVTLLTDFGTRDGYVAALKGILLSMCREPPELVDISHEIAPQAIPEAAYLLDTVYRCFPPGTSHLVVVDPGVGSQRRGMLIEGEHRFVGPDNGVFSFILGQPDQKIYQLSQPQYFRPSVSPTFHGRDIFAPVMAHLLNGIAPGAFGPAITDPTTLGEAQPQEIQANILEGTIIRVDHFGNLITNIRREKWATFIGSYPFEIRLGKVSLRHLKQTYADGGRGEIMALINSAHYLEIAQNCGHAATYLDIHPGERVWLKRG
jgi:S-adenosylmethionine hydrolase